VFIWSVVFLLLGVVRDQVPHTIEL